MNLTNTIVFSVATGVFLIALHQSMMVGFASSYWLYMISIGMLLYYKMKKGSETKQEKKE
ncbi:MAG: hypothetical protein OEW75_04850 [Cyclobacteriaceae bacterium]|nr:hypothetical protein [Cyclobacteriaceae bacterium]